MKKKETACQAEKAENTGKKTSRAMRIGQVLILLTVLLAAAALIWLKKTGRMEMIRSAEGLREVIASAGGWAGAVYFFLQMFSVIIAPIPSNVTMMAGALALGFGKAALLGMTAIFLGSMLTFSAARIFGRRAVARLLDHSVLERYLPVIREKQDVFLFLTMLFPFFPDDMLCLLAGLTEIPASRYALIIVLARPWGLLLSALLGSGVLTLPAWAWAAGIAGGVVLFIVCVKNSKRIERKLFAVCSGMAERIGKRKK